MAVVNFRSTNVLHVEKREASVGAGVWQILTTDREVV